MKIVIERCRDAIDAPLSIEAFADRHGLIMRVCERDWVSPGRKGRFIASFSKVDVKDGCCARGEYGEGSTILEAIKDYANVIRGKLLIYDALGPDRREFYAHIS